MNDLRAYLHFLPYQETYREGTSFNPIQLTYLLLHSIHLIKTLLDGLSEFVTYKDKL